MPETLRVILAEHLDQTGRAGADFVFGKTADVPFEPTSTGRRARKAWEAAALEPVGLHQCRHAHGSFLDAAGVSEARADRYMGHAGRTVADRYRHRLRGQLASDGLRLDGYLTGDAAEVVRFPTGASAGASTLPVGSTMRVAAEMHAAS
jgi:integrase